jgi:hypothetical protein
MSIRASLFLITGTAVLAAACGGGSMPATPSASAPKASGAVVQGTVAGVRSATQGASRASATGLRVSVVGTSLATSTDGSGRFVLTGVPTGTVTLRFEGDGVDARLEISGLADGQVITIVVRVAGHDAALLDDSPSPSPSPSPTPRPSPSATPRPSPSPEGDDDHGDEVDFKGTVQSVTPPDLRVAGRTVHTDGNTRIVRKDQRIGLSEVKVGSTVEVEGVAQAGGSVLAKKIKVEDGGDGHEDDE